MSLADAQPVPRKRPGPQCGVARILAALDPVDRQILESWIADTEEWSPAGIAFRLTENGHPVGEYSVASHRRRMLTPGQTTNQCACPL